MKILFKSLILYLISLILLANANNQGPTIISTDPDSGNSTYISSAISTLKSFPQKLQKSLTRNLKKTYRGGLGLLYHLSSGYIGSTPSNSLYIDSTKKQPLLTTMIEGTILSIRSIKNSHDYDNPPTDVIKNNIFKKDNIFKITISFNSIPYFSGIGNISTRDVITFWTDNSLIINKIKTKQITEGNRYFFEIAKHEENSHLLEFYDQNSIDHLSAENSIVKSPHNWEGHPKLLSVLSSYEANFLAQDILIQKFDRHLQIVDNGTQKTSCDNCREYPKGKYRQTELEDQFANKSFHFVFGRIVKVSRINKPDLLNVEFDAQCTILFAYPTSPSPYESYLTRFFSNNPYICLMAQVGLLTSHNGAAQIHFTLDDTINSFGSSYYKIVGLKVPNPLAANGSQKEKGTVSHEFNFEPIGTSLFGNHVVTLHHSIFFHSTIAVHWNEMLEHSWIITPELKAKHENYKKQFMKTQEEKDQQRLK